MKQVDFMKIIGHFQASGSPNRKVKKKTDSKYAGILNLREAIPQYHLVYFGMAFDTD